MDYMAQPALFKIKKALRYIRLYGPRRTLVKIKGQYHAQKEYDQLPKCRASSHSGKHVGLIGCGGFAYSNIAWYLTKKHGKVIRAAMDVDANRAASLYEAYSLDYYADNAEELIQDPEIKILYIASNHASHADYAIRALEQGKHVHIEKPHVVNEDQLQRLCNTMTKTEGKVNLGFNRPYSPFGQMIKAAVASQSGPAMFNWFIAGHRIEPEHWYFKEEEGGRILGNLCHWTDFVFQLTHQATRYPITIQPTRYEQADSDIAVTYTFGEGTIAVITFSAKGHTFEGVRERFAAHRGNVLIAMDDFKALTIENVEQKMNKTLLFRNHGHEAAILASYAMIDDAANESPGATVDYVWQTGEFFLKTKEACETRRQIVLDGKPTEAAA